MIILKYISNTKLITSYRTLHIKVSTKVFFSQCVLAGLFLKPFKWPSLLLLLLLSPLLEVTMST